ncbi:MAG: DUF1638 domain-containing protein [Firmicutes bacterium]|nr:DUF1638 domain-containing protein [Bacillota bacterium]MBQ5955187.1 DUF1638 domain-containing protein [Bacillota bacterium]
MNNDNTVILACTSLKDYVDEAQKRLGTNIKAIYVSRLYHRDPKEMREHILEKLDNLPEGTENVLVCMGYCGGSWEGVAKNSCRIVLPRIDDCVSLVMQLTDEPKSNLKEDKHFYVRDKDPSKESIKAIFEHMANAQNLDQETREKYHKHWQDMYEEIDIIDTPINDARSQEYYDKVKVDADWLDARLEYVMGGTHMIEKLIKGDWDDQFLVLEPGEPATKAEMLI